MVRRVAALRERKACSSGLEFGTTGLHQPYPILVKKGRIFDHPLYVFPDAGASGPRSYALPDAHSRDYKVVAELTYSGGRYACASTVTAVET